jgi:hypothetical protein
MKKVVFLFSNAPASIRMGTIDELAQNRFPNHSADATSVAD